MNDKKENKVVAIYVRVSTEKQEYQNQIEQLTKYCNNAGYEIYKIYKDVISGAKEKRPAFDEMFKDAHQLKFNMVLFWSLDRFSRAGLRHTINKLYELENLGIVWHSYTEPYISTLDELSKNMILAVMSSLAKIEREKISLRTKLGLQRAKKYGTKSGRPIGRPRITKSVSYTHLTLPTIYSV